ncbi:MAG: carboxylating nicotinate-nucleotide diphosphorylase [Pyrobaculum sp.]
MIEARLFAYQLLEELRRDIPLLDYSAAALPLEEIEACVVFRKAAVAAGVEEAAEFLKLLGFRVTKAVAEGTAAVGDVLCFQGPLREVAKVERTVLNVIIHASGVATYVKKLVEAARAANPRVRVAATRKTLPFLRYLEKKAVWVAGGDPHRSSLTDAVMYKDTHKWALSLRDLAQAPAPFVVKREVEVSTAEEAVEAAMLGFDVVMLDNAPPEEVARAHRLLTERGLRDRVVLEASGGIDESNISQYAPYVDVISIGKITHSAPAVDAALEVRGRPRARVGLLGFGALGREVARLVAQDQELRLTVVYDVDRERCREAEGLGARCVESPRELAREADYVVEAAGVDAVLQHGCEILEAGAHLITATVGAAVELKCRGPGVLFIPSGAVGGLDLLAAAGGKVRHRVHKAVEIEDSGPAAEMFRRHPRSLNSSVALQTAAGSETYVELKKGPPGVIVHEIEVEHPWGRAYVKLENYAVGRSSLLAAASLYRTLKSAVAITRGEARAVVGTFKTLP